MDEIIVNSTKLRKAFGGYLQQVKDGKTILIQMFDRKPGGDQSGDIVAAIVPMGEYEEFKAWKQNKKK